MHKRNNDFENSGALDQLCLGSLLIHCARKLHVQCWVWWLVMAHLLNLPTDFDPDGTGLPGESQADG